MQSGTTIRATQECSCFPVNDAQPSLRTPLPQAPLPIVVIDQNMPALGSLIQSYLGLAQIALVPNQRAGRRLLASLANQDVEILAVIGFSADICATGSSGRN